MKLGNKLKKDIEITIRCTLFHDKDPKLACTVYALVQHTSRGTNSLPFQKSTGARESKILFERLAAQLYSVTLRYYKLY